MKIVQINSVYGSGSTGRICLSISRFLSSNNIENFVIYSMGKDVFDNGIKVAFKTYIKFQALRSRVFGNYGFTSRFLTKRIISVLSEIKPDIVHIHNIHGYDCNVEMLLNYIADEGIRLVWTFHDCWAFTGYCTHFLLSGCEKWRSGCEKCGLFHRYSFFFNRSSTNLAAKIKAIKNAGTLIVTPSKWLKSIVQKSLLADNQVEVINNGIDLSVFTLGKSDFREKYSIPDYKKIVLGVAQNWSIAKGSDVFFELAKKLDYSKYQIVLVGTIRKKGAQLPKGIIYVDKTDDISELVDIYRSSDVFLNPTREDTFPTVNIEALACGVPVITFDTGGAPEIVNEKTGYVISGESIGEIVKHIKLICEGKTVKREECRKRALNFSVERQNKAYYMLYKNLIEGLKPE